MFEAFAVSTGVRALGEMGDEAQIVNVMLAAKYETLVTLATGTSLGTMIANVPAGLLGDKAVKIVPITWVHRIAAVVFAAVGGLVLVNAVTR